MHYGGMRQDVLAASEQDWRARTQQRTAAQRLNYRYQTLPRGAMSVSCHMKRWFLARAHCSCTLKPTYEIPMAMA